MTLVFTYIASSRLLTASSVLLGNSARGQIASVAVDSVTIDTRTYDDGGRMTSSSYQNGVSESRSYNDDNTLASISYSGAAIGDLTYGWDANKNKTSESIGGVMSGYGFTAGYDAEDRLTSWDRADTNLDQSWNLSPVGDWNSITENSSVQNRTHGPAHELLTAASQSVEHDPKGNMTLIPPVLRPGSDPLKLKWDFDDKLRAADTNDSGTDDVSYRWDALGRRVGRDDGTNYTIYFQDGQQTLADYAAGTAASSPTYNYVHGSYIDEILVRTGSGGNRYYHRNQQYSITAITDGGGAVVERYAYTAYGQVTFTDASGTVQAASASNNRYTYTGREWDHGLSLYHYRARMYDAITGRFCSRDPIGYKDGQNLYSRYIIANATDPTGEGVMLLTFCRFWSPDDCPTSCKDFHKDDKNTDDFIKTYINNLLRSRQGNIDVVVRRSCGGTRFNLTCQCAGSIVVCIRKSGSICDTLAVADHEFVHVDQMLEGAEVSEEEAYRKSCETTARQNCLHKKMSPAELRTEIERCAQKLKANSLGLHNLLDIRRGCEAMCLERARRRGFPDATR